ncbi:hypothetical protein [Halorubrum aethiopicum]|uniref:hypothetical protein n=1 Tax=Halorubrum aethiopicum TaxID=1758255 RepID=UPI000833F396|nr:hypothetical protein [Halorubrum aethiopicum]
MSTHHTSTDDADPRPKAVLFCPDCGHESGLPGDWIVDEGPGRTTHTCPACDATVEERRRPEPLLAP